MLNAEQIFNELENVRKRSPLVHNITNYVVMNYSANALLALGASPVMAHAPEEVEDMVSIAGSLVINMGTLSRPWVDSMLKAMRAAKAKNIPVVFDPVGAGATPFRNEIAELLLKEGQPSIIRGNASEILALRKLGGQTKGVDSTSSSEAAIEAAFDLAKMIKGVVCVSGETDFVISENQISKIKNGHPMMTKVTGMGCSATAVIGAFAAVGSSHFDATQSAMATMSLAGEKAILKSQGPGSFAMNFLDEISKLQKEDFVSLLKLVGT